MNTIGFPLERVGRWLTHDVCVAWHGIGLWGNFAHSCFSIRFLLRLFINSNLKGDGPDGDAGLEPGRVLVRMVG